MDKDDDLFGDQIDEDDDLLNISLDELSHDEIDEPASEEPDQDIIELIDLLEKGDADLLGIDDESDELGENDISSEELDEISSDDAEDISSDLEVDDLLLDSDLSDLEDDLEPATDDDLDQLLAGNSLDDLALEPEEAEITDDALESLLDETELEELTGEIGIESDDTEDLNLQMEDTLDESDESDRKDNSGDGNHGKRPADEFSVSHGSDKPFELTI